MLTKEQIEYLKQEETIRDNAILFKEGYYYEFSNFHQSIIGKENWPTVEHFYQANKTLDSEEKVKVLAALTPNIAKKLGKQLTLRPDWEEVKYDIMYAGVKEKFTRHNNLKHLLLRTGNKQIIEWTWWGDKIWGMCSKTEKGCNALGKILQMVRSELMEDAIEELLKTPMYPVSTYLPHIEVSYEFVPTLSEETWDGITTYDVRASIFVRAKDARNNRCSAATGFSFVESKEFAKGISREEVFAPMANAINWLLDMRERFGQCIDGEFKTKEYLCPTCGWNITEYDGPCSDNGPLLTVYNEADLYDNGKRWTEKWKCPDCETEFEVENGT